MKFKLIGILTLLSASAFAGPRVFIGFGFGGGPRYYAPPVVAYAPPPPPPLYYARPAYGPAIWIGPRWNAGRYYRGYWRR